MRKILIANRGEIARRVLRTCHDMGYATVAVFSAADAGAAYVGEADEAVALGGSAASESYLNIDAVVGAAARSGADALHPGYGFLSENAALARRCAAAGLTFIGPSPEVLAAMGSKLEAKRRMEAARVPVLASVAVAEGDDPARLREVAAALGYPLLVKASAGGGGRGMRIVGAVDQLAAALAAARSEAVAAFGDGTLYLERYLENARHVEVQIFGDAHGNVVHLYERECSVQRRHQKIIEEAPCPALGDEQREALCAAAVRAGREVGYRGAGTVEFMVAADASFYFLEINARLQVEHPVTECITGLDLVRWQLEVAEGGALPAQDEIPARRGHAIECRLYAEDPRRDFAPVSGTLQRFAVPLGAGVRVDAGVADGSTVGVHYDAMLAKVIAHAASRTEALRRACRALAAARIHGLQTNRELLVGILSHPRFLAGEVDTHFLVRHAPVALVEAAVAGRDIGACALAAALAAQAERRGAAAVLAALPSGFRNNPAHPQEVSFAVEGDVVAVEYRWQRDGLEARIDGTARTGLRVRACSPDAVDLEEDGLLRRYEVHRVGDRCYVDTAGSACELRELPRFPLAAELEVAGSLTAPMPAVVRRVLVAAGDRVERGQVLLVLEAMKMEQPVLAPGGGIVRQVSVAEGAQVEAGQILALLDSDD